MLLESQFSPLISKYEEQLEKDPRSRVFAPLAEAYRKVGLIENAFKVLQKGIRYNPDYLLGYLTLAQCYLDKGEYSLSYNTLRPLAPLHRDNIKLQTLFAISAEKTGNKEEALDTYKYLLFLQPKDEKISFHVGRLEKEVGESSIYETRSEEVSFDVEALKPSPELDRALDDWVQIDLNNEPEEDELDEWSTDISQAEVGRAPSIENLDAPIEVEEVEGTPVITHTLVDLYLQQGHKEKAIELLEKIIQLQPENKETQKRLDELTADIEEPIQDEGRSLLMAAFDQAQGKPIKPKALEVVKESLPQKEAASLNNDNTDVSEITRPLEDFLKELSGRNPQN